MDWWRLASLELWRRPPPNREQGPSWCARHTNLDPWADLGENWGKAVGEKRNRCR